MSEGRELACALHFQLEAAVQLVGALGGCILVMRSLAECSSDLTVGRGLMNPADAVAMRFLAAADDISSDAVGDGFHNYHNTSGSAQGTPRQGSANHSNGGGTNRQAVAQFRCVALCGRTAHRAFSHESMLTGVAESRIALNIALAAEPFLAVPLTASDEAIGVLCLAYKANPETLQFGEEDECHALACSRVIAATLTRCAAARFVAPYDISRLAPLRLSTTLAPEVTVLERDATSRAGNSAKGLIYRSSSRAVLSKRIDRLQGEEIPSLPSLMELSQVIGDLESLLLRQKMDAERQVQTQHGLERRLRNVQHDLCGLQISSDRQKAEGEAFRLSGQLLQQQLNTHIARSEVAKHHRSEMKSSVNAEVLQFLTRAKQLVGGVTAPTTTSARAAREALEASRQTRRPPHPPTVALPSRAPTSTTSARSPRASSAQHQRHK